ncbi:hypothetical protein [Methylophilus sp. DW102]|uniref:hypothetical protein n=1 Tax=Methylophilus sp. DW102 TaxID=3095607 RepID=UPI00308CBD2B|nr:hypothetical protein MTDW_12860 [Methylophilus sp. DW102]BEV09325.1 hypothetical protein MTDW_26250 [Methylophilus sp. DW102]
MADLHWPPIDEEALQPLPPVLRAMVKALGFGRAIVFLQEYGGIPFTLPKLKDNKMGLMPDELARLRITLKQHLDADNRIALPKADKLLAYVRDQEITKHKDTESIVLQARKYHLTTRHVLNIRGQHRIAEKNASSYKRNLSLTKAEIEALLRLTYQAAATEGGNVYANLVHKLDKVNAQIDSFTGAQFDLF